MIVSCEQCQTQFRLDDAKVPESGARVRCSRCNHAFFIPPPGQADDLQADELAREAAESRAAAGEEESDWQFNDDAGPAGEAAGLDAAREAVDDLLGSLSASVPASELPAADGVATEEAPAFGDALEESPVAETGSPEGWNFFEDASDGEEAPASIGRVSLTPRWKLLEQSREEAETAMEARAAAAERDASLSRGLRRLLARVATGVGWTATLGLLAAGAWTPLSPAPEPAAAVEELELPGLRAFQLEARWIDNAVRGPLYVVSGRLQGMDATPRAAGIAVRLLDAGGAPLAGATTPLGPPFPERALREADPAELRAAQARAAAAFAQLHRGETVGFQALFADVPPEAARFALEPGGGR